jgi:cation transport ATPase
MIFLQTKLIKVENFEEQAGKGIQALVAGSSIKIGSRDFVLHTHFETDNTCDSEVELEKYCCIHYY